MKTNFTVDLTNCDQEPIRTPGSIQPHGALCAVSIENWRIAQVSANIDRVFPGDSFLHLDIGAFLSDEQVAALKAFLADPQPEHTPLFLFRYSAPGREAADCICHRAGPLVILEFEFAGLTQQPSKPFLQFKRAVSQLQNITKVSEFADLAVRIIKNFTGFDRVMFYRFHADYSGEVIAEAKEAHLEPYLGLHYPASDIPRQARELYVQNLIRIIPDIGYKPVPLIPEINPETGDILDMSFAGLRSVSPIHVEYLQNMGVGASMSVSLVRRNELLGLIACHHYSPRFLHHQVRTACEFIGQALGLQFANLMSLEHLDARANAKAALDRLAHALADPNQLADRMKERASDILDIVDATSCVVFLQGDEVLQIGETPPLSVVRMLTPSIDVPQTVEAYDRLSAQDPVWASYKDIAAGALVVRPSLEGTWVVWFRPEQVTEVTWAGKPEKIVSDDGTRLSPRKSFAKWSEYVRGQSRPWRPHDREVGLLFSHNLSLAASSLVRIRMQKALTDTANMLRRSNKELERFAYVASHDLQEPLRAVAGCLQVLERRHKDAFEGSSRELLNEAVSGATRMRSLITGLLEYSRVGREQPRSEFPLRDALKDALRGLTTVVEEAGADIEIGDLPVVYGNQMHLTQLFQNLISNAIKFRRKEELLKIRVASTSEDGWARVTVSDNGIGIEPQYHVRIFEIFQRLHTRGEYEGTGIGLALCKRIVEQHGGEIGVENDDPGTTFWFTLPLLKEPSGDNS